MEATEGVGVAGAKVAAAAMVESTAAEREGVA